MLNSVAKLILLALLIRELFSFWTGHPFDFELWVRLGYYTVHLQDPYGFLPAVPGLSFSYIFTESAGATIGYLPFWPMITATMYLLYSATGVQNRFFYYFLLKQPIIVFDVFVAYLLYKYIEVRKPSSSEWALRFWLYSPFTIIISSIWGMFDSVAITFLLLGLLSNNIKKGFWLGVSIFVKSIPVIYAIPISSLKLKTLSLSIAIPVLTSSIILFLFGWPLQQVAQTLSSTVIKGGESMSAWEIFFLLGSVGALKNIPQPLHLVLGLLWIPALLLATVICYKRFGFKTDYGQIQSLIALTLIFFIFKTQINEQYFLYLLALVIIDVAIWNKNRLRMVYVMITVALVFLIVNNFLLLNFLSPAIPSIINSIDSFNQVAGVVRIAIKSVLGLLLTILNLIYLKIQFSS